MAGGVWSAQVWFAPVRAGGTDWIGERSAGPLAGQSPVPAAAMMPSRIAASNRGGQGPCPATT